jgi:hypothetical protein
MGGNIPQIQYPNDRISSAEVMASVGTGNYPAVSTDIALVRWQSAII